jgi:acyl-[acyl-carrier-protein]-phospholipid O-acyltransferase/long-chain-fatty-acid--[acyl-carrier-protein] ligase
MADGHGDSSKTGSDGSSSGGDAVARGHCGVTGRKQGGLWSGSFVALLVTQFLVALNDNIFRWLIIPIGAVMFGDQAKAMQWGSVAFLIPFILLAGPAGYFADRYSKRRVMIACKVAEIVVMVLGIGAILTGHIHMMMFVLFLMGAQSAFFSPAKYASIPEIVRADHISSANGLIGMTTMIACIVGAGVGTNLFALTTLPEGLQAGSGPGQYRWWISAAVLVGVAIVGWIASLFIGRLQAASPDRRFPRNPAGQVVRDLRELFSHRSLYWAALGSAYFWSIGLLAQSNIDRMAMQQFFEDRTFGQPYVGLMLGILTLGIGAGCVLAGIWSRGKVELGIVPLGAGGLIVMSLVLAVSPESQGGNWQGPFAWTCLFLMVLGLSAGLYDIPLLSWLQERSSNKSRGRILAAYNFISFSGMMLTGVLFGVLGREDGLNLSARWIWFIGAVLTIPVFCAIVYLAFTPMIRVIMRLVISAFYRVRVKGLENIPDEGGALLVANHVTWLDGVLLILFCPRPVRFIAYADLIEKGVLGRLARDYKTIPIQPGRKSMVESLRAGRQALREGDLVCIFPEGGLSRTGQIQGFRRGFVTVLHGTGFPVIPVHLGGLWGSIFSFERGKFFWKWPLRIPYPVSIVFGRPMHGVKDQQEVRLEIEALGYQSMLESKKRSMVPARAMLRACRKNRFRRKIADSTGLEMTGGEILTRSLIMRRLLRREVLQEDESMVGLLLPPSVAGLLANAALALDRRVAVNLNYTVSNEIMNECIEIAGIRHVLTSRKVMEKFGFRFNAEVVYLEDLREKLQWTDKLAGAAASWLLPSWLHERLLGLTKIQPDDLITLIFTSGSTGLPKGVMLTQHNIGSNVEGFSQVLHMRADDVLVGILPFFHSFGYTTTIWTALMLDPMCVYHYSPLEARQVGKLTRQYKVTILLSTPTFLRSYTRRCDAEDFASLEVLITGAEKLPMDVADAFEAKFGIRPVEGYGTTELSPVVSTNIPASRIMSEFQQGNRIGSVGQPMPGISAKIVDPETGENLGTEKSGMLLIKGPNVMKGYLGQPELTARVLQDGWYTTGDIAKIDADGYIHITGRQSRFSKIGGEMVPHLRIEEILSQILGQDEEGEQAAVVTGVPDAKKGERIVVLYRWLEMATDEVCRKLGEAGLPPIWIPSPDSFFRVDEIPILGTGKLDLKRVKDLALKLTEAKGEGSGDQEPAAGE